MQITAHVHVLKMPFQIPAPDGQTMHRFVNIYLLYGPKIWLIDSGVAGTEHAVYDYLQKTGRRREEIGLLLLTHTHPDHIGAARALKDATGCEIAVHPLERHWLEDLRSQAKERPVPGLQTLARHPARADRFLAGGESLALDEGLTLEVTHTPGHSPGSLSFFLREEGVLFTGDAVPLPQEPPIFDEPGASMASLRLLSGQAGVKLLAPAWDKPRAGVEAAKAMQEALLYLTRLKAFVAEAAAEEPEPAVLAEKVTAALGLGKGSANPLVARTMAGYLRESGQGGSRR